MLGFSLFLCLARSGEVVFGITGRILHTLIGYTEQPTALQLIAYLTTLAAITGLTRLVRPAPRAAAKPAE